MEIIRNLFGTIPIILILILFFLPTITLIIQLIANFKIIKNLPEIDYKLNLIYKKLYNLEEKNEEISENSKQIETDNNTIESIISTIIIVIIIIFTTLIIMDFK